MAIESVKRVYIVGHRESEVRVLRFLQGMGVVEVEDIPLEGLAPAGESDQRSAEVALAEADWCLALITKHAPPAGIATRKVALSRRELDELAASGWLEGLHGRLRAYEKETQELKAARTRAEAERAALLPWVPLESSLDLLAPTSHVRIDAGAVPQAEAPALREALASLGDEVLVREVNADARSRHLVVLSHRSISGVEETLKEHEFAPAALPVEAATPRQALRRLEHELERLAKEERRIHAEIAALADTRPRLLALHDHWHNAVVREKVRALVGRTGSSFCLAGWVSHREMLTMRRRLAEKFDDVEVLFAEPGDAENAPIILCNNPAVEPFEIITDLYGRPVYRGVDPTPYLSLFFAIFFGFCLTDAGYGLVLMAVTSFLLLKAKPDTSPLRKKFYRLFFLGGITTALLGAMVGGWFGVTVRWKLIDPLKDLFLFFGLAIALGVVHLFTGLSIRMVRNFKAGDWEAGIWDQGLWMTLLGGVLALGLAKAAVLPPAWAPATGFVSLASALGIVFFQGRGAETGSRRSAGVGVLFTALWLVLTFALTAHLLKLGRPVSGWLAVAATAAILGAGYRGLKGILARVGMGLYSLYGFSGFIGDTLSYSRLVALGLTTGIIGMVVNKMAGLAGGIPWVGPVFALAILVGGHIVNLVINMLGAFVHSLRLQYVEFFTKFYESGGRPFRPFRFESRHTVVSE